MPLGLDVRCRQILNEIVTISQAIRTSALGYADSQNFNVSARLRSRLETVRISADAILEAITEASLTDYTIDDRLIDWLLSGEPRLCLGKLKEMEEILNPISQVRPARTLARPLRPAEDKITAALVFLDKHAGLFHFLLTPNIWNRETSLHSPSEGFQINAFSVVEEAQRQYWMTLSSPTATQCADGENEHVSELEQAVAMRRQKLDEVLRWLSALNCTEKHNGTLKLRQEGTCKWFPTTDAYKSWRTGRNRFLWLQGKAGCGKSVVVASTIEHLKNTLEDQEVLVFFYCDFQNERSTSPTEMMRSFLSQLVGYLRDRNIDLGDLSTKILDEKSKGTLMLNDLDKLCDLVSRAASCFPCEPIIVIDALDECADIEKLLRVIVKLNDGDVRLLVTSRPHEDMMHHFAGLQSLSFDNVSNELAADIALHVGQELDSHGLRSADLDVKDQIRAKLIEKAWGRFRWVQCQLDTLKRCATKAELKEALGSLPSELEVTYERILEAIDERKAEGRLARHALAWLVVALEPLRLAQIVDGLLVDAEQRTMDRKTEWLRAALLNSLSSLVSYQEETDLLALSHFSVKEYLTSSMALQPYHVTSQQAHADVAQTCFRYISDLLQQKRTHANAGLLESSPMLSYVFSSGFNHIAHVDPGSTIVLEALESLGSDVRRHPSHWERLCQLREEGLRWPYPPWPSSRHDFLLYILIAYSSFDLFQSFLFSHRPLKPRIGTNPLVYAADLRKTNHAMVLLSYGVNVNVLGLMIDDCHKASPLEVAIDLGDDVLVGELLRRGCVVTSEVLSTAICMPWCSTRVLLKLMQTGEFVEWAKEIGDEQLFRGVFNSARPNAGDSKKTDEVHVALARRLCEIGQDLSANSPFGVELIERAVHAAHTSVLELLLPPDQPPPSRFLLTASTGDTSETVSMVHFLLSKGVDIHAVSTKRGDTALHLAAISPLESRSLELTRVLIDAGCDPRLYNFRGETPLTIAVQRGYLSVVDHLMSNNILLPPDILLFALRQRSTSRTIRFLILKGADIHSTTPNGDGLLHLTIAHYYEPMCLDLLKAFIRAGCNTATRNSERRTIFEAAIERDYLSVVEYLLSQNLPLPPDSLLFALQNRSTLRMVKFLIRDGAGVNSPGGDTLLHLAVAKYHEPTSLDLVKNLLDAGCNPTTRNSMGKTVFEVAFERDYTAVVEHLLSLDVRLPSNILSIALQNRATLQMVESLIFKGANVQSVTANGDTILHLAIAQYFESTCLDLVKIFVDAGCNPAIRNSGGKTFFEVAFERDYTTVLEHLLSRDVPLPSDILATALENRSTPQMVKSLILKGANVHSTISNGDTALHLAISLYSNSTFLDLLKCFIDAGCDPKMRNSDGETVFEVALERDYTSVAKHLLLWCDVPAPPNILPVVLQKCSDPHLVKLLLLKGADVNSTTFSGDTALHLAISKYVEATSLDLVQRFIEAGCNPTACNSKGKTVFETAIEHGYCSVVEHLLLRDGAFRPGILSFPLWKRTTPQMIKSLIRQAIDVRASRDTVLHLAIAEYPESTCLELVKRFMEAGCNPTARNSHGKTALTVAIERGYGSVAAHLVFRNVLFPTNILSIVSLERSIPRMVESLVRKAGYLRSASRDTVLHLAIAEYPESTCLDLVKRFIEAGCNPTARNCHGKTAFDVAIERGYSSVAAHLVLRNALFPTNILSIALLQHSIPEMLESLIRKAIDMRSPTASGDTVLHLAVAEHPESTCLGLVKRLIKGGCNPVTPNSKGKTVLELAFEHGYSSVVEHLLSCNIPLPKNILPIAMGNRPTPRIVVILLRKGADVNAVTLNGDTLLHVAIANYGASTCLDLMKRFINAGCNPTAINSQGKSVLECALERGYGSVVEHLLSCNILLPYNSLLIALKNNSAPHIVQLLIRQGADLNYTTSNAVLHLAITEYDESKCLDLVETLVEAGCDPMARNSNAETALEAAMKRGYTSVVQYLLSRNAPLPPAFDILSKALQQRCDPVIIRTLTGRMPQYDLTVMTDSNWNTLLHLAHTSYIGFHRQWVIKILTAAGGHRVESETYQFQSRRRYVSMT